MDIQKLTKEQAVIISGFTGILCGEFSDFHADVEKRLGRGVQTFEFGFKEFATEVKKLYEADFIEMGTVDKEQAKAQAVPEWISVEDGLPSDGQNIIAFDAIKHCVFKDGEFLQGYFEPDTGHEYTEPVDVTHWIAIEPQEPTND